jgi:hypothetical protein
LSHLSTQNNFKLTFILHVHFPYVKMCRSSYYIYLEKIFVGLLRCRGRINLLP